MKLLKRIRALDLSLILDEDRKIVTKLTKKHIFKDMVKVIYEAI